MSSRAVYLFVVALIPSANLALAATVWFRARREPATRLFVLLLLSLFEWTLAYGIQFVLPSRGPLKGVFADLQYLGAAVVPALFLLFAQQYAPGIAPLRRGVRLLLFIEPVLFNVMVWTDPLHHLFRKAVAIRLVAGFEVRSPTFGPVLWVHTACAYALLLAASILLLALFARSQRPRRSQAFLLLASALAPWLGSFINILGLDPSPIESTHYGFLVTSICLFTATSRFRLFTANPKRVAERILGTMSDFVLLVDSRAKIVRTNAALIALLGFEPREILHGHVEAILANPRWEDLTSSGDGSRGRARPREDELMLRKKGGAEVPVSASITPFVDDLGALQGYLLVGRDLTERRRLEEEHARAVRLEAARQLAGGVAHDFNNILAAVALHAEFLSRKLAPGHPLWPSAAGIAVSVRRASEQADKLLLFSGSSAFRPERLDLNGIIADAEAELRTMAKGPDGITLELASTVINVRADRQLLRRALVILVARAGAAAAPGEPVRIHTAIVVPAAPDGRSRLPGNGVSQASVGIVGSEAAWPGSETTDRFNPYAHSEHSIDTDLDLTAAASIVAQHGGSLQFRPTGGRTIELQLLLPLSG